MKKQSKASALKEAIVLLENSNALEFVLLKEQLHNTYESLKPINQIKSIFKDVIASPKTENNILDTAIGLTTGYLSKKALVNGSHNPVAKILGSVLQAVITNVVSKHSTPIKTAGGALLKYVFKNKHQVKEIGDSSIR